MGVCCVAHLLAPEWLGQPFHRISYSNHPHILAQIYPTLRVVKRFGLGVSVGWEQGNRVSILPASAVADRPKQAVMPEELTTHN